MCEGDGSAVVGFGGDVVAVSAPANPTILMLA